jgi:predicted O-methyltransferase YrrM
MLLANPEVAITVVDLFSLPYASACFDYLDGRFPGRLVRIRGDSREVVPQLSGEKFDLVHIDGGKEMTLQDDLANTRPLVSEEHVLIIDDTQNVALNSILAAQETAGILRFDMFAEANAEAQSCRWKHKIGRFR